MFAEGGNADARTMSSRAKAFFDNEILELLRLVSADKSGCAYDKLGEIVFGAGYVEMDDGTAYAMNYTNTVTIRDGGVVYSNNSQGGLFCSGGVTVDVIDGALHVFDGGTWWLWDGARYTDSTLPAVARAYELTEADQAALVSAVLSALPIYAGEVAMV